MSQNSDQESELIRLGDLFDLELLETEPEEVFDSLTSLARELFQVPIALFSLVDEDRQWFKSNCGLDASETSREVAFCDHTIRQDDVYVVEDATKSELFMDNPLVTEGPKIRFYAGCPIKIRGRSNIGTLCLIDYKERAFDEEQRKKLKILAIQIESNLDSRLKINELRTYSSLVGQVNLLRERKVRDFSEVSESFLNIGETYYQSQVSFISIFEDNQHVIRHQKVNEEIGRDEEISSLEVKCSELVREKSGPLLLEFDEIEKLFDDPLTNSFIECFVGAPLFDEEKFIGVLGFFLGPGGRSRKRKREEKIISFLAENTARMMTLLSSKKQADLALEMFNRSPSFVATFHAQDFRATFVNDNIKSLFRKPPQEIYLAQLFPKYVVKMLESNVLLLASSQGHWKGRSILKVKGKKEIPVLKSVTTHRDLHGELKYFSVIMQDLTDLEKEKKAREAQFSRMILEQETLNHLLSIHTIPRISLDEKLRLSVEKVLQVDWLAVENKGGIFLVSGNELELVASVNLGKEIESRCARIKKGECLCGLAFEKKKIIFANCVDKRHEIQLEGMEPHGHYNLPIMMEDEILGVMVLYLPHGHVKRIEEQNFLAACTAIISKTIYYHQKEKELIKAKELAEEAVSTKSDFLAMVSHEIRTPMNGILGMTSLLMEELDPDSKLGESINIIKESGESLLELVNNILDLSKLDAKKVEIEEINFSLLDLIETTVGLYSNLASKHGSSLKANVSEISNEFYRGDEDKIRQILNNLIQNAIKFTKNGEIEIGVEVVERNADNSVLKFWVKDNGIGIAKEKQEKIFEAFAQSDTSISRLYGGTGLGLSLCKELSELLGGRIWLDSELHQGSTFFFQVPLIPGSAFRAEMKESSYKEIASEIPLRIMVADDNQVNQIVMKMMLEKLGYGVDSVYSGIEVIEMLKVKKYDLILMDCHMPEMDGFEATRKIKSENLTSAKILAVTASTSEKDLKAVKECGMDGVIKKPVLIDDLVGQLKAIIPSSSKSNQLLDSLSSEYGDDPELINEILLEYKNRFSELLTELEQVKRDGDIDQFHKMVHELKGMSANLFLTSIVDLCQKLEKIKDLKSDQVVKYLQRLEQERHLLEKS